MFQQANKYWHHHGISHFHFRLSSFIALSYTSDKQHDPLFAFLTFLGNDHGHDLGCCFVDAGFISINEEKGLQFGYDLWGDGSEELLELFLVL